MDRFFPEQEFPVEIQGSAKYEDKNCDVRFAENKKLKQGEHAQRVDDEKSPGKLTPELFFHMKKETTNRGVLQTTRKPGFFPTACDEDAVNARKPDGYMLRALTIDRKPHSNPCLR
jgi:hypothetical protein